MCARRTTLARSLAHSYAHTRTVKGVLKGFDSIVNLVLDDCSEYLRGLFCLFCFVSFFLLLFVARSQPACLFSVDPNDSTQVLDDTRYLGLVVCRGTAVMTICPPGELIANPFAAADDGAAQ